MTLHNTLRYVNVLDDVVHGYNTRYHSSTGFRPVDGNETNAKEIFILMFGNPSDWFKNLEKPKFKLNDHVRISRLKGPFEKGYEETYSREIYIIKQILDTVPREYKLKSIRDEDIRGRFYEKELIRVKLNENTLYHIEKIIKHRSVNGVKQVFVKWKGWDKSHNQWIDSNELVDI